MKISTGAAILAVLLAVASPAQAFWKVTITSDVPKTTDRWAPEWKRWTDWGVARYYGRCWKVGGHEVEQNPVHPRVDHPLWGNGSVTLNTEVESGCKTSALYIIVWHMHNRHHAVMTRQYTLKGEPGGLLGKWHYEIQDREVARRYFNDANICSTIKIFGDDKPDEIHSWSC